MFLEDVLLKSKFEVLKNSFNGKQQAITNNNGPCLFVLRGKKVYPEETGFLTSSIVGPQSQVFLCAG